ncbi:hypothetical protein GW17_00008028 [Ensete ventricosum]|nr:hypothetical protein GW17_00008028 [Ensete ventricosum]
MPRVRPRPLASGPTWLVLDAPQRRQQKRRSMQSNEESKSRLTPRGRSELLLRLQEGKEVASLLRWLPIPVSLTFRRRRRRRRRRRGTD